MRKAQTQPRVTPDDPLYHHKLVTKLINRSMYDGKRATSSRMVYKAFERIRAQTNEDPVKIFLQAIENIKPNMEVRARRIGGAAYQVPSPVWGSRKESLAIRWLIQIANTRPNSQYKTYSDKLAAEIVEAARGEGGAVAKKRDMERQAEANRAFAHFKW